MATPYCPVILPHNAEMKKRSILRAILHAFSSRDSCLLMRVFLVYIRPIVEYNSIIWLPATMHDIDSLEPAQRRFTKRLSGLKNLNYYDRLERLNAPTAQFPS